ncbi:MAG: MFS transporter [Deltaproteobacteria bacterium]|nr:MAG: MFS transporter [Deltaproteobacteria bacterium]
MIYPLIPLFLTEVLGATPVALGLVEGVAEATASLLKALSGYASDRWEKRKPFVFAGYGLSALSRPLIGLAGSWPVVLLIRFADRVGKGVRTSPRDALIADVTPRDRYGTAYSLHRALDHAGAVVGPFVAWALLSGTTLSIRSVFLLAFIPGAASLLTIHLGVRETNRDREGKQMQKRGKLSLSPLKNRSFFLYLSLLLLFTIGNGSDAFILLKIGKMSRQASFVPLFWGGFHVVKSLLSLPAGLLADRWGRKKVVVSGWLSFSAAYLLFGLSRGTGGLIFSFLVYSLYYSLTEGVEKAIVAELVAEEERGTAFGLFHLTVGVGALPASILFGFLWKTFGAESAFFVSSGLALLSALLLSLLPLTRRA